MSFEKPRRLRSSRYRCFPFTCVCGRGIHDADNITRWFGRREPAGEVAGSMCALRPPLLTPGLCGPFVDSECARGVCACPCAQQHRGTEHPSPAAAGGFVSAERAGPPGSHVDRDVCFLKHSPALLPAAGWGEAWAEITGFRHAVRPPTRAAVTPVTRPSGGAGRVPGPPRLPALPGAPPSLWAPAP